jgi:Tol biopolymer transport system component
MFQALKMAATLTAEALADLESPHDLRLSPCGQYVVYTLRSDWSRKDRWVAVIWMADVGKENSARQLTTGRSNDTSQFSPHSKSVAFLSDQTTEGTQTMWSLSLETEEAFQITPSDH